VSAPTPQVVLVEDDPPIRRFVHAALGDEGLKVHEATSVRQGLIECATRKPDLVLLDLGLPDGDGVQLISELRGWSQVPVLVLSARGEETQKVAALDAGADDYLVKPFGMAELLARVRALLRRSQRNASAESPVTRIGDVGIDLAARRVWRLSTDTDIHLTPIEYRLLAVLVAHLGRVLTHRQLLKEVWGPHHIEHPHYLRVYMQGLRRKLEVEPASPKHLLTEIGVGYRLVD
jgi:two-component system, OmpR family, KDP operon response regulator KdpE